MPSGLASNRLVDAHHHLWDLARPGYAWLRRDGDPGTTAWIGDYAAIRRSYLIDDYLRDAEGCGLVKSVHVESGWGSGDSSWESRWLQETADRHGFPHAIVASVDLSAANAEAHLDRHLQWPNVRGVRMIRMGGFSDPAFRRGFAGLAERGLVYDANLRPEQALELLALAEAFPATTIAVDNLANPATLDIAYLDRWTAAMRPFAGIPNVLMKVSGLGMADHDWTIERIRPWVLSALEVFAPERCMFGSNWPVDGLYSGFASPANAIRSIVGEFSSDAADQVFRGTAERCYRI
jgi:predicted TIM-barrel fold metal-dependent hydrolase